MVAENSSFLTDAGGEGSYSEVIAELAALAAHARDPEARATFELLGKMFRTLSAGHDTFAPLDSSSDTDPSKPQ